MSDTTTRETPKAAAAYAEYAAMGPSRSLAKLAQKHGKSTVAVRQLEKWSSVFSWQARVKAYDAEKAEEDGRRLKAAQDEMDARQAILSKEMQEIATQQIRDLILVKSFGSIAAVQLLKNSIEAERKSLRADDKVQKVEVTGKDGGPIRVDYSKVSDEELSALERIASKVNSEENA